MDPCENTGRWFAHKVLSLFHGAPFLMMMIFYFNIQQADRTGPKVKSYGFEDTEVEMPKFPTASKSKGLEKQLMTLLGKIQDEIE